MPGIEPWGPLKCEPVTVITTLQRDPSTKNNPPNLLKIHAQHADSLQTEMQKEILHVSYTAKLLGESLWRVMKASMP
jgi:hypothetical protein